MKRFLVMMTALVFLASGCTADPAASADSAQMSLEEGQMRTICNLSVYDCYYLNVAKFFQEDAEKGILFFPDKDKRFWIEYSGIIQVGIDVDKMKVAVDGTRVTVELPPAKIMGYEIDEASLTPDSFIVDKDSADVTAADEQAALQQAQEELIAQASSDTVMLEQARQRAQTLLEEYIRGIAAACNQTFTVEWVYLNESGEEISRSTTTLSGVQ